MLDIGLFMLSYFNTTVFWVVISLSVEIRYQSFGGTGFLHFYDEEGGIRFRNDCTFLPDYTTSHSRKQESFTFNGAKSPNLI
jgi:hypothetical protein